MKTRVYIDTSVFGGYFDDEFTEHSTQLIEQFKTGRKVLILSDLTLQELENAPKQVRDLHQSIPTEFIEFVTLEEQAKFLALKYIEEEAIPQKFLVDAQHIAIATINRVDVLVSWNFRHIVNLRRIQLYNATNLKYGYALLEIRSPREIIDES
ncbi:MAG: PIN domain-containing protein [bacterium]